MIDFLLFELEKTLVDSHCKVVAHVIDALKAMKSFRRVLARHLSECEAELTQHGESACCPVVAGGKQSKG